MKRVSAKRVFLFVAAMLLCVAVFRAEAADEKYFVRELKFSDGAAALTVMRDAWQPDAGGLLGPGGVRLTAQSQAATMLSACQWADFTAKMVDFPSDESLKVDAHQRSREWFAPRGADDACLAFVVSGKNEAVAMRAVFIVRGKVYCVTSGRLKWGTDIDAAGFTSLERDFNILSNYIYFEKSEGYGRLKKALAEGGLMVPADSELAAEAPNPVETPPATPATPAASGTLPVAVSTASTPVLTSPMAAETPATETAEAPAPVAPPVSEIPRDADLTRADRLKLQGKFAEAEQIYSALLAKAPYEAGTGLGDVYAVTGRYDEAIERFSEAATIKPNAPEAFNGLGSVYFYRGEWSTAKEYFSRALGADPKNITALSNLGWVALAENDIASARENFNRANENGPPGPESATGLYTGLAQVAILDGQPDAALGFADLALKMLPDSAAAHAMKAQAFLAKGDAKHALDSAARAAAIEPERHEYHALAAMAADAAKDYPRAISSWTAAVQNTPPESPAGTAYRESLARAYLASGDKQKALDTVNLALEAYPADQALTALKAELEK